MIDEDFNPENMDPIELMKMQLVEILVLDLANQYFWDRPEENNCMCGETHEWWWLTDEGRFNLNMPD